MEAIGLYTEARNEYLKQLSTWIVPPIVEFYRKEYGSLSVREGEGAMASFQDYCAEVPRWNQDVIEKNINIVLDTCRCDYVEELMTAVFIAHTKVLTSVRVNTKQKKLQITLPKLDHFLHRVFTECARMFWKAPFLFSETLSYVERQKNILQAESMCTEALSGAIRSLLPVKNILRDYLEEDEGEEEEAVSQPLGRLRQETKEHDMEFEEAEAAPTVAPAVVAPVVAAPVVAPVVAAPTVAPAVVEDITLPESSPSEEGSDPSTKKRGRKPKEAVSTTIEKIDTLPDPVASSPNDHSVQVSPTASSLTIEKAEANPTPPQLLIETEPAVHFTPYDTVYDESVSGISEIRYAPKISSEDKPPSTWGLEEDGPTLTISSESTGIVDSDIVDLEGGATPVPELPTIAPILPVAEPVSIPIVRSTVLEPVATPAPTPAVAEPIADIDMPLNDTSDFVELA